MAFEDLYFKSPSQGLLNLRYRPDDYLVLPVSAINNAQEVPGRFCVARVSYKYGAQVKKPLTADAFSDMQDSLLEELSVAETEMEPEIRRNQERRDVLSAIPNIEPSIWKNWTDNENRPIKRAEFTVAYMIDAIKYWRYEEDLCIQSAIEKFTRN